MAIGPQGTFGGEFGARHRPQGPTGSTCATAPQHSPLAKLHWADLLYVICGICHGTVVGRSYCLVTMVIGTLSFILVGPLYLYTDVATVNLETANHHSVLTTCKKNVSSV